jgi:rubrerythrin
VSEFSKSGRPHEATIDLSEREILALAIFSEEEDNKIYPGFAEGLREQYPASAKVFDEMADEEVRYRTMLFDFYRSKFGDFLPLIRRQDVKGFIKRKPLWLTRPLGLDEVRKYVETMGLEWARFYRKAAKSARDSSIRELLDRLADAEDEHESLAHKLSETILTKTARAREDATSRRLFVLQNVQPGLAGLMDGYGTGRARAAGRIRRLWVGWLIQAAATTRRLIKTAPSSSAASAGSRISGVSQPDTKSSLKTSFRPSVLLLP